MATHSSTLAWKIPWTEEPGGLQSMGSRRVGHNWATSLWLFTFMHWRRKWQPTPVFLPGESQGQRSLVAAVYGVVQSWTRLKWLSSSSSSSSMGQECGHGIVGASARLQTISQGCDLIWKLGQEGFTSKFTWWLAAFSSFQNVDLGLQFLPGCQL